MMSEATVAAHVGVRVLDAMTRQNESLYHGIVTLAGLIERLEEHTERIEQRLSAIESHIITTNGANP